MKDQVDVQAIEWRLYETPVTMNKKIMSLFTSPRCFHFKSASTYFFMIDDYVYMGKLTTLYLRPA
jgi:hypothetical protein